MNIQYYSKESQRNIVLPMQVLVCNDSTALTVLSLSSIVSESILL